MAIAYDLHLSDEFAFDLVVDYPPYAIVAADHRFAGRKRISLSRLAEEPMILLDLPHSRDYFKSIFISLGLEPRIEHRTASPNMVRSLVANGFGYSLLNARLPFNRALDGKPFHVISLSDKVRPLRLGIVVPRQTRLTRAAVTFGEYCKNVWAPRHFPRSGVTVREKQNAMMTNTSTSGSRRRP